MLRCRARFRWRRARRSAQLHPNEGATIWTAPNCPVPKATAASRRTATRVTLGAISLSSSSFSAHAVFVNREPSRVSARFCQAGDETCADRVDDSHKHDRHGAGRRSNGATVGGHYQPRECPALARPIPPRVYECRRLWPSGVDPRSAPSLQPNCFRACVKPRGGPVLPHRQRHIHEHADASHAFNCCARAANGHATAAPPSSVMNSRRSMQPPTSGAS